MPYRITHDSARALIEVAYMGSITGEDLPDRAAALEWFARPR